MARLQRYDLTAQAGVPRRYLMEVKYQCERGHTIEVVVHDVPPRRPPPLPPPNLGRVA
jgi:hypothetical protein